MSIDPNSLDEVSRDFIAHIAEQRPDWLAHARSLPNEASDTRCLVIEFPSPPGFDGREALWISTYGREVTVGMDAYHAHFPWPTDYNGEDGRPAAMEHVDALMDEKLVVVSLWDGDRDLAGSSLAPGRLTELQEVPDGPQELRVRSWRGTYNRTLRSDWDTYLRLVDERHSSVFRTIP